MRDNGVRDRRQLEAVERLRVAQLLRLLKSRGLHLLPNDDQSRRWLRALIEIGANAKQTLPLVPWMADEEFGAINRKAVEEPRRWNPRGLGNLFEITMDEKLKLGLRNVECHDRQAHEIQELLAQRRRDRDRKRKQRIRQGGQIVRSTGPVAQALATWLGARGDRWFTITEMIAEGVGGIRAFRSPRGGKLYTKALRCKLWRAAEALVRAERVEVDGTEIHARGLAVKNYRLRMGLQLVRDASETQ